MTHLQAASTARRGRAPWITLTLLVGLSASTGPVLAQTREAPLTSRSQLLAAPSGARAFWIDDGVEQVWLDVRQAQASDSVSVRAPSGLELGRTASVQTLAADLDAGHGDLLGQFVDATTWTQPQVGAYELDSSQPYLGIVTVKGGGSLDFWVEPLASNKIVPPGSALTLYATLRDAQARPLTAGVVTALVEQTALLDGRLPEKPFSARLTFTPVPERGQYVATLPSGLSAPGLYTLSVEGTHGLLHRQLATSLAVARLPLLAADAGHLTTPLVEVSAVAGAPIAASPGTITYYPEDAADPDKPVVVFVHGFSAGPEDFFGSDGFAGAAREANYRVAVVALHPDESFTTNGALLGQALPAIAAYYDVRKLVVVAHSKGGVDTDAAMLFEGRTDRVKSVITLSTPHWGTPLADLADSDWLWWLAELFGRRNPAQRAMKPASMALFRAQAAAHPRNTFEWFDVRTAGGWKYWSEPAAYYTVSGVYLANHGGGSGHGGNDGVINYRDTLRPVSTEMFAGRPDNRTAVNHRQIRQRGDYWRHVQAQLLTVSYDNAPAAPAALSAVFEPQPTGARVRLGWQDKSRRETGFVLERSEDGAAFVALAPVLPANSQESMDTSVRLGHTYVYRLRARLGERWISDYSNSATVTLPAPVPAAPTELVVSAPAAGTLRLHWRDNASDETGFEIVRRHGSNGGFAWVADVAADAQAWDDTGLPAANAYEYKVRAVHGAQASAYSNVAGASTWAEAPVAPSGLSATFDAATRMIALRWMDNSSNEDAFQIQFSYSGSAWGDLSPATVAANVDVRLVGPNLPSGGPYQFRVRALRAGLASAWSNNASVIVY